MKITAALSKLSLAGLLCLCTSINGAFAADTGNLAVSIKGDNNAGVKLELSRGVKTTPVEKKTSTEGSATFKKLTPGTYTVTARKGGTVFSPETRSVTVVAGRTLRVKMRSYKTAAKVGMKYCVGCHAKFTPDVYSEWLKSPHGNFQYVDAAHNEALYSDFTGGAFTYPADHTKFSGFPSFASIETSMKNAEFKDAPKNYCVSCHGASGEDNQKVAGFPLVRADGTVDFVNTVQAARPVVSCEACHGGSKEHISHPGRAPAFGAPSAVQCGQCHNNQFPVGHLKYHPMGAAGENNPGIYEAYQASGHPKSVNEHIYTDEKKTTVRAVCARCHTDEGARLYKAVEGDRNTIRAALLGEAAHTEFSPVQCRTCHSAHNPEELLESATAATATAKARSAEFNTCTNCHQLLTADDLKIVNPYHSSHGITNTHYDDPATAAFEGYTVNRASNTACSDCHNPHVANAEINKEWAHSAHGELTGEGWVHYDWKGANRQACQKCHTTTGFVNYVKDPVKYNPVNNDFSHLTGMQNETLYCQGCHSNSAFDRRKLTTVLFPSGFQANLGDDSNLCMVCHSGRASKKDVDAAIAKGTTITSFVNVHYLPASATLFGTEVKGGYEYAGKSYVGRNSFPGHAGKMDTCVKCHLRSSSDNPADHHFMPAIGDCAGCHGNVASFHDIRVGTADYDGDGNVTESLKSEIEGLQTRLLPLIYSYATNVQKSAIVYDAANNPYWFRDANGNGVKDAGETSGYNKYDAKLIKAAYNYHMSIKEPGNYIHNHKYIVQLLIDSIEEMFGNTTMLTRP